jgi:MATE family multidrug resistance protein
MNRRILYLAIPNIVTNISIPLLGMVDLGLMGHLDKAVFVGAIALGSMIFNFMFWGFGFLRMGTSGFTAQAFGARDFASSVHILGRALLFGLIIGLLLIILQFPIAELAFRLVGGSPEVESLARSYFNIRIYAAPATLCIYGVTGWLIGMQNARYPMMLAISINALNILFSLFFIKVMHAGSDGIAWASVISQYIGAVVALLLMRPYFIKLKKHWQWSEIFQRAAFLEFFHVNKDIFIRTMCLIITLSFFTAKSARMGDTQLAVNTLLFQFFYFFSYLVDGFGYAAEALAGKYKGSRDPVMLKRVIKRLFVWGALIAVAFSLIYLTTLPWLIRLLTQQEDVILAAKPYYIWIILIPLMSFAAFIWDGIYVGVTASRAMRNSMLIVTLLIFFPAYFLLVPYAGPHALWIALLLFMAGRGVMLTLYAKTHVLI